MWTAGSALPASAQVSLIVGSVRDQHGAPIEGATVLPSPASAGEPSAVTDASGTFSLQAGGLKAVAISCRYCAPVLAPVTPGKPVIAIVRRFDALFDAPPSAGDLANLPYAHVEESVALRPFTFLSQWSSPIPGDQLSDRGLQPSNALLVDAGVPNYDVVFGASPYTTIPAQYERSASVIAPSNAFLYGDQAGAGVVSLQPYGEQNGAVALTGSDQTARFQIGSDDGAQLVAGTFSNSQESRQRFDAFLALPLSTAQTIQVSGGSSQGREYGVPGTSFGDNFTFAKAAFDDAQPTIDTHASFLADRGDYAAGFYGGELNDVWSDVAFDAGVRTRGPVQAFADVSSRLSTGTYDARSVGGYEFGGQLTQNRLDAGVEATGKDYDVTAGAGFFGAGYSGGSAVTGSQSYAHTVTPSLAVALFPKNRWSVTASASGSIDLPSLWQQYGWDDDYQNLTYNRDSLYDASVTYTDLSRVTASFETASQRVRGFDNGLVTSSGLSVGWQISPLFSLRAWRMLVTNSTYATQQAPSYPIVPQPSTAAVWMTYQNGDALRFDAIYRRDLLNNAPFYHFDGDISGPIAPRLRWYAGAEDRQQRTFVDVGLRFSQ